MCHGYYSDYVRVLALTLDLYILFNLSSLWESVLSILVMGNTDAIQLFDFLVTTAAPADTTMSLLWAHY